MSVQIDNRFSPQINTERSNLWHDGENRYCIASMGNAILMSDCVIKRAFNETPINKRSTLSDTPPPGGKEIV